MFMTSDFSASGELHQSIPEFDEIEPDLESVELLPDESRPDSDNLAGNPEDRFTVDQELLDEREAAEPTSVPEEPLPADALTDFAPELERWPGRSPVELEKPVNDVDRGHDLADDPDNDRDTGNQAAETSEGLPAAPEIAADSGDDDGRLPPEDRTAVGGEEPDDEADDGSQDLPAEAKADGTADTPKEPREPRLEINTIEPNADPADVGKEDEPGAPAGQWVWHRPESSSLLRHVRPSLVVKADEKGIAIVEASALSTLLHQLNPESRGEEQYLKWRGGRIPSRAVELAQPESLPDELTYWHGPYGSVAQPLGARPRAVRTSRLLDRLQELDEQPARGIVDPAGVLKGLLRRQPDIADQTASKYPLLRAAMLGARSIRRQQNKLDRMPGDQRASVRLLRHMAVLAMPEHETRLLSLWDD